jgi:hypothetical protein
LTISQSSCYSGGTISPNALFPCWKSYPSDDFCVEVIKCCENANSVYCDYVRFTNRNAFCNAGCDYSDYKCCDNGL